MRSSKSRSRNKSRNNKPQGNVVNRVFDSSGPEGKVRGTPQQIIDKYNQLARDAQLSGDRVATENFQQHAEHYLRLLAEAQREQDARREEQEKQNRERQAQRDRERQERMERQERDSDNAPSNTTPQHGSDPGDGPQPDVIETSGSDSGLVETPEEQAASEPAPQEEKPKRARRPRKPRAPKGETASKNEGAAQGDAGSRKQSAPSADASSAPPPEAAE